MRRSRGLGAEGARAAARPASIEQHGFLSGAVLYLAGRVAWLVAIALVLCHAIFAAEEHSLLVRLLTAVPGVLLVIEIRRYLRATDELPFIALGLVQYYLAFSFPVFFKLEFFDLAGPVFFSTEVRNFAAAAVALGAAVLVGAAYLGLRVGRDTQPLLLKVAPPAEVPARWDSVFLFFASAVAVFNIVFARIHDLLPMSVVQPLTIALGADVALGLALALQGRAKGLMGRYAVASLMIVYALRGLLTGMLEPVFRAAVAYMAGAWTFARRFSVRFVAGVVALFLVLQPIKASYRSQVWGAEMRGASVSYGARATAWAYSFRNVWGGERTDASELNTSSVERLAELGAVMHAFQVVPGKVQSLEGQGLLAMFYAFIPRAIWADKPTTRDTIQRYAVIFGRQTERGANTTAINLPLLVEGYWNLGWPGIVLVSAVMGFWLGLAQRLFASGHWALRALGITQITRVTAHAPVVYMVGLTFQSLLTLVLLFWGMWAVAKILSGRERQPLRFAARRTAAVGPRHPP